MNFPQVEWIAMTLAIVAFAVVAFWLVWLATRGRLMRCPVTGGVAFVDVNHVNGANGEAAQVGVRQCDLWPNRQDCAQGCLVRYSGPAPRFRVELGALRPFERP
jgi:hypothetical protein